MPGDAMRLERLLDTEDERAARRLIEQAGTIVTGLYGDMPESFTAQLFARAAPEDLTRYEPRELAALAEEAWAFLKERKRGSAKVRFQSRPGPIGAERIKTVSIIEIVNDDMPFLLDSVMHELTELGIEVRLVVHPIFTVERDNAGTVIGFRGDAPAVGAAQRESFIHIHVERIEVEAGAEVREMPEDREIRVGLHRVAELRIQPRQALLQPTVIVLHRRRAVD